MYIQWLLGSWIYRNKVQLVHVELASGGRKPTSGKSIQHQIVFHCHYPMNILMYIYIYIYTRMYILPSLHDDAHYINIIKRN